jgi:class 3 adenylate cyclase
MRSGTHRSAKVRSQTTTSILCYLMRQREEPFGSCEPGRLRALPHLESRMSWDSERQLSKSAWRVSSMGWIRENEPTFGHSAIEGAISIATAGATRLASMRDRLRQFLGPSRQVRAVMFTDMVGSTRLVHERGIRNGISFDVSLNRPLVRSFSSSGAVSSSGKEMGALIVFDLPSDGALCAIALRDRAIGLGLEIRAGLHVGEVDAMGGDVFGMTVHVASRLVSLAEPGQIVASEAVREVAEGADVEFRDMGEQELRDVGTRRLFLVARRARR